MRESVKIKRKLTITAIAIVIALIGSVAAGLLAYSSLGKRAGIGDGLMSVADSVNIQDSNIGNVDTENKEGDPIETADDLKKVLAGNLNGYIPKSVKSLDLQWNSGLGGNYIYTGNLEGNGCTINLLDQSGDTWVSLNKVGNGSGYNYNGGMFVAQLGTKDNRTGSIKNLTFNYSDKTLRIDAPSTDHGSSWITSKKSVHAAYGFVCGENFGTIENVRVNLNNVKFYMHANQGADTDYANQLLFGGIVGSQCGTLNKVFVNMTGNTAIEVDAKNWNKAPQAVHAWQFAAVGGVYGMYNGVTDADAVTAAQNTSNLMSYADNTVVLRSFTKTGNQKGRMNGVGAVAGWNIKGVSGVVWDYRGKFEISDPTANDQRYIAEDYADSHAAAATGVPNGYYSPTADFVNNNGQDFIANYQGAIFNSYWQSEGRPIASNGSWGLDTSDSARGRVYRDKTNAKIYLDEKYSNGGDQSMSNRQGNINMDFTENKGELHIWKDFTENSSDIFWRVGTRGSSEYLYRVELYQKDEDGKYLTDTEGNKIKNINSRKGFDQLFNMAAKDASDQDSQFEILVGKYFSGLQTNAYSGVPKYTGQDFLEVFTASIFSDEVRDEIHIFHGADIQANRQNMQFVTEQGRVIDSFITPEFLGNVTIKAIGSSDAKAGFSYVDSDVRACFGPSTIGNMQMQSAEFNINVDYKWTKKAVVKIKLQDQKGINTVIDGAIDNVDFRMVNDDGTTDDKYINQRVTYTRENGAEVEIEIETSKLGNYFQIYLKKGEQKVGYVDSDKSPVQFGPLKIDKTAPEFDINGAFSEFTEQDKWYFEDKTIKFDVNDALSGVNTSYLEVKEMLLDSKGNEKGEWIVRDDLGEEPLAGNKGKLVFNKHAKYQITIKDMAGNESETLEFTTKIDKIKNEITNVEFENDYVYDRDGRVSNTVYVIVSAKIGHSGAILHFEPTIQETAGDKYNLYSTIGNAYMNQGVVENEDGSIDVTYRAGIQYTQEKENGEGIDYNFVLKSGEGIGKADSTVEKSPSLISVGQPVVTVTFKDLEFYATDKDGNYIDPFTKPYDGTSDFFYKNGKESRGVRIINKTVMVDGETKQVVIGDNVELGVCRFVVGFDPNSGSTWDPCKDVQEEGTAVTLIIRFTAKLDAGFAISNNQKQNNLYPVVKGTETYRSTSSTAKTLVTVDKVGITKKKIDNLKVENETRYYGEKNPQFRLGFTGESQFVNGEQMSDIITDDMISFNCSADDYYAVADKNYAITATIKNADKIRNYEIGKIAQGYLRVERFAITTIHIENPVIDAITSYEQPNVKAYFYDAFYDEKYSGPNIEEYKKLHRIYLEIVYKNSDKEVFEFIPGVRTEPGIYFYVIIIDDDAKDNYGTRILQNYVNITDPNNLITPFYVAGEVIKEDVSYSITGLDKETGVVTVDFRNEFIDFKSLIRYKDTALSDRMEIWYGSDQSTTDTNINVIGEYYVTLMVMNDSIYGTYIKPYLVKVVPAKVTVSKDDYVNAKTFNFENTAYQLTKDDILTNGLEETTLKKKLDQLLTDSEKADFDKHYTFAFSYKNSNGVNVNPNKVINADEYTVTVAVTSKKIQRLELTVTMTIATKQMTVEFDFDKFGAEGNYKNGITSIDRNTRTITKTFSGNDEEDKIYLALNEDFEKELKALLNISDDVASDKLPYLFTTNGFFKVGEYEPRLDFRFGNSNIEFVDNNVKIKIDQLVVKLSIQNHYNLNYQKGGHYIWLTQDDLDLLNIVGIDAYKDKDTAMDAKENSLEFDVDKYIKQGVKVIRDRNLANRDYSGVGLYFENYGDFAIKVRSRVPDNNFSIEITVLETDIDTTDRTIINVSIKQGLLNEFEFDVNYILNGAEKSEKLTPSWPDSNGNIAHKFVMEYNGTVIILSLNGTIAQNLFDENDCKFTYFVKENGRFVKKDVGNLWLNPDTDRYEATGLALIDAGEYRIDFNVDNQNINNETVSYYIDINKKVLGENVGKFNFYYDNSGDPFNWLINGNAPTDEDIEEGLVYRIMEGSGDEARYSIRLIDEEELIAKGFEIVYKYDGVVADYATKAGAHKVTAEISYRGVGSSNWEVKVVELWRVDADGNFVLVDKEIDGVMKRVKEVVTFNVAKADIQPLIDAIGSDAELGEKVVEYDGTPQTLDFDDYQYYLFETNGLKVQINSYMTYTLANEYTIKAIVTKVDKDGNIDFNYETGEIEGTLIIEPKKVDIVFVVGGVECKNGKLIKYNQAANLDITAYYKDRFDRKIEIKSFLIEAYKGNGDDRNFWNPEVDKKTGKYIIEPGQSYMVTANIADSNYTFDEETDESFLFFKIRDEVKETKVGLFTTLGIIIALLVAAGFVALYMRKMFNPAVQEFSIDEGDNE